ncbi:MAG TPA: DegT/DnrJ/EryC1/StrS family aminotransferase, partial [Terriglobales bacterium]|nr:DegT/DnrJ/EryC1/StrS family aminotransferase [Terriglobales bacterium]
QGESLKDKESGVRVRTLLPVHLFGRCCAMRELTGLAAKYGLTVVEDVAQACGARCLMEHEWKFAGTMGDLGCFSFFPSKNLGACGDAGFVSTGQEKLAESVRVLRVHGERTKYHHEWIGLNSRLDSIQAAILSVKLRYLEGWCEQRIAHAHVYDRLFQESGLVGRQVMRLPPISLGPSHVFNNYVISVTCRDALRRYLHDHGIQSEVYYPLPLHLQRCFASLGYRKGDLPVAEQAAGQVLALPLYPEMTLAQQELVIQNINDFFAA